MTKTDAQAWIGARYGEASVERLGRYVEMLLAENRQQNLISKASEAEIWVRHILDSAQLARLADTAATWLDIGSGPGLPGLVLACISHRPITLVEPRRRRVDFLHSAVGALELRHVTVEHNDVERLTEMKFEAITARACAPLARIFSSALPLSTSSTIWLLPKGRKAAAELSDARSAWQGVFHVEQSLTDADSGIIVARGVRPR